MAYKDPAKAKAWREANKVRLAAKKREWYVDNVEISLARAEARRVADPDQAREDARIRYAAKRDAEGLPKRKPAAPPKPRVRKYSDEALAKLQACRQAWKLANPDQVTAATARRRASAIKATPRWSDASACAAFYKLAKRREDVTGIPHHVDHIVPLRSKLVSGLHVPANLRVVPAAENMHKGNRHWPDMP